MKKVFNPLKYIYFPPEWIAGFATGESNFFITLQKYNKNNQIYPSLRFSISQHSKENLLLKNLVQFFKCG